MAIDRLVLLEPRQSIPLEAHQPSDGAVAFVEQPNRRFMRLPGTGQREYPRRPELDLLCVVLVAQELGVDVRERNVVLGVVRHLPYVSRRGRVEDQLVAE